MLDTETDKEKDRIHRQLDQGGKPSGANLQQMLKSKDAGRRNCDLRHRQKLITQQGFSACLPFKDRLGIDEIIGKRGDRSRQKRRRKGQRDHRNGKQRKLLQ